MVANGRSYRDTALPTKKHKIQQSPPFLCTAVAFETSTSL